MANGNGKNAKTIGPIATQDFVKNNGQDHVYYTEGPSLTRQEFAEECDINRLMARFDTHVHGGPGGMGPMPGQEHMFYADFAEMPSNLLEYMEYMDKAETAFMTLPAVVRKEFDNSAMEFVAFASDRGNLPKMQEWGLAPKPAPEPAPKSDPVEPLPESGK